MLSSVLLDNSRLEATMDRRTFIRLVAGSAACSFVGGAVPAGAEELDDNFTPFSPMVLVKPSRWMRLGDMPVL